MGGNAVLDGPDKPGMPQPGTAVHVPDHGGKSARMVDCITAPLYAAIDLGSSNCRLLVARPCNDGFKVIDAFSRVVRLGEGVREKGYLCDAAMDRAIDALKVCAKKLRR
ncbi:MAG TPA: Ppx/GppA family phosphatase, partial [Thalassospira sp.]|nr:Ppx/GppA family phosphatase [Thalassospira sp.]